MFALFRRITFWMCLAGLFGLVMLVRATTTVPPMPEPPVKPAEKPFSKGIGSSGIIEALRENTQIGVPEAGIVQEIPVKVWDRVKRGDVLLRLDDRQLQAQIASLKADLKVREAEIIKARREFDRQSLLSKRQVAPLADAQTREDDLRISEAQAESTKASIQEKEALVERLTVRAPIDGTILQANVRVGEYASPGTSSAPVVLGALDEFQVRADVDEQLAPRVRPGARAVAYRKGDTTEPIPLDFVRIEPFITPKKSLTGSSTERVDTRVLTVIYRFPNNPDRRSYVGQQVDVFIEE
jgi:HlyD family secretion protein